MSIFFCYYSRNLRREKKIMLEIKNNEKRLLNPNMGELPPRSPRSPYQIKFY